VPVADAHATINTETMLIQLVLDVVILVVILETLLRERAQEFPLVCLKCLAIGVANWVCRLALTWLAGHLVVVPMLLVDGFLLMYFFDLKLKQTAVVLGLFFVFRVLGAAILGLGSL